IVKLGTLVPANPGPRIRYEREQTLPDAVQELEDVVAHEHAALKALHADLCATPGSRTRGRGAEGAGALSRDKASGAAGTMLLAPSGWTLTEATREVRLPR